MSTFGGVLAEEEFSFLRIDNFENDISNGRIFMLSHFHGDHYRGLLDGAFLKLINENPDVVLYCTQPTKQLLLAKANGKIQAEKVVEMNINSPYVFFHNELPVTAIALPAGHCPGSAMFYIEFQGTRIIYTGDIRLSAKELKCYKTLHDSDGHLKPIKTLYLDTTFCDPKWLVFPTREQSLSDIESIISCWLAKDEQRQVGIQYNTYYGLEWVLCAIAKRNGTKIWVLDERAYNNYSANPELIPFLSKDKENCKIHLCRVWLKSKCPVCSKFEEETLTVKPCAMSFNFDRLQKERFYHKNKNFVKVAYATHCSFVELTSVVRYLKPEMIIPCVLPTNTTMDEVMGNLSLNVEDCLIDMLNKKTKNGVKKASTTIAGPSTSSSNLNPFSAMRDSFDELLEKTVEEILETDDYDSTLKFNWKRSYKIQGNMIPYNIIWEEEISSDSLENQDSPRTNLVDRPLTETRQMPSSQSPVEEVCAETSESPPTNEEVCIKFKREENANSLYPKKIKNVDLTKQQEYSVSSNDIDESDSMDHLDTPPSTTKKQKYSVSSNETDASDSMDHLDTPPTKTKKQKYSVSSNETDASDSMDHLDTPLRTTKEQEDSDSSNDADASDSMDHLDTPLRTTKEQEDSDSSNDADASDSMEYLDTPPY